VDDHASDDPQLPAHPRFLMKSSDIQSPKTWHS
jgi:hypothetical protein